MKKTLLALFALALFALPLSALAGDRYYCTVTSTSPTASNTCVDEDAASATSGQTLLLPEGGADLAINCDADAFVGLYHLSTRTVTALIGVPLAAKQHFDQQVYGQGKTYVSVLAATGTAKCKVFVVYWKSRSR